MTSTARVSLGNVEVTVAGVRAMMTSEAVHRREWIELWFGARCPYYDSSCIVCKMWRNQDEFERTVKV